MKKFRMTHDAFEDNVIVFQEDNPPWWLLADNFKWFWDKYVMTMDVGATVQTDYRTIERIQ